MNKVMAKKLMLLAFAIVVAFDEAKAEVCVPSWKKSNDTRSFSGSSRQLTGVRDVDNCKSGCIARTTCIGIDFKRTLHQCWLYINANDFRRKHANKYIDQYTATRCPSSACNGTPCKNNGTCTDSRNSYTCSCLPGFAGKNCQTDFDECSSTPCQNNGTCADNINFYNCSCLPGYTGAHCETDVNECASTPCQNNGTCTDNINFYNCSCLPGYTGANCETDIDECSSSPCQNNGTCNDGINMYNCTCTLPCFNGTNCEIDYASRAYSLPQAAANTTKITIPSFAGTTTVQTVNGWIVIQQQIEKNPIFYTPWTTYKTGFGIYNCNFWLGLDKIYQLTSNSSYRIRFEFLLTGGNWSSAEYSNFYIENELANYTIHLSGYFGNTGDIMINAYGPVNGMSFSTYDRDTISSCASKYQSGFWWYNSSSFCGYISMNSNKLLVYCYPSCSHAYPFLVSRILIQQV